MLDLSYVFRYNNKKYTVKVKFLERVLLMNFKIFAIILTVCLLLCSCKSAPETTQPVTDPTETPTEESTTASSEIEDIEIVTAPPLVYEDPTVTAPTMDFSSISPDPIVLPDDEFDDEFYENNTVTTSPDKENPSGVTEPESTPGTTGSVVLPLDEFDEEFVNQTAGPSEEMQTSEPAQPGATDGPPTTPDDEF